MLVQNKQLFPGAFVTTVDIVGAGTVSLSLLNLYLLGTISLLRQQILRFFYGDDASVLTQVFMGNRRAARVVILVAKSARSLFGRRLPLPKRV